MNSTVSRRQFLVTSARVALGVGVASLVTACAPQVPAAPTAQSSGPVPKGPVTLEFWQIAQGPNFDTVMKDAITAFESSHPSIKVNLSVEPFQDMDTKIRPIFTSGGPGPDVLMTGSVATLTYARMPFGYMDLTDRIAAAQLRDKTPATAWAAMTDNGRLFGIPFDAFPFLLHYNRDLYEAAGVSRPPETQDELLSAVKKIHDPSKNQFGFLVFTSFPAWILEQLWYNNGAGYFEGSEDFKQYDTTKPIAITEPEAVASLEFARQLAETAPGGLAGNIGVKTSDSDAMFARGNLGHFYTHTIHTSQIPGLNQNNMVPKKNFDVAVFPAGSKRRGTMFSTSVFGVAKKTKDADASWEFVKYLSDEWEGRIAPAIGCVPARNDAKIDESAVGGWLIPVGRQVLSGDTFLQSYFPQTTSFATALTPNVEAYFSEKKSAKQALEDVAAEAKKSLTT
jgi:ABC-type glycerol-3-phosphate transport system substrate-binding protein